MRTRSSPYSLDLRMVRAARRTPSAPRGSRSAGSRGSPSSTCSDVVLRDEDLQRADPDAHHHADGERVDVEVRDDDQVPRFAAGCTSRYMHALGLHDVREDVARASASRPSASRSCRRCTAGRRRSSADRSARAADRRGSRGREQVGQRRCRRLDARRSRLGRGILGQRRDDDRVRSPSARATPSTSGASASSVITSAHAGVGRDGQHLARGVARVDVDDDRAEPQHRERGDDVLRTVGSMMPTRSPLTMPSRASAAASASERCLISRKVSCRAEKRRRRPIRHARPPRCRGCR